MQKYTVIIIGSGFGGQIAAINLLKRGIEDFKILERRNFMGGTWCQNTYPGAAVDVQSPLYSISAEPYQWTRMFAKQQELVAYTNHVIDKHQLRSKTLLSTNVLAANWNAPEKYWQIKTNKGDFQAQFIINASGALSTPAYPDFEGKDNFEGTTFHTNNWNHAYNYKNKKVAIIGSGASAAQVIPAIANDVDHLYVFQRSPHWVMPRPDFKFPAFIQKLLGFKLFYNLVRWFIYWALETRLIGFKYSRILLKLLGGNRAKRLLKKQVKDPELRAQLTPDYTIGCKRVLLSNTLYPALCQDNVTLLTKSQGIEKIIPSGIITKAHERINVDLIIYATGYNVTDGIISYAVTGKNDQKLSTYWNDFPRAYLGVSMPDFPNFFLVTGPNTGIGHTSALFVMEAQIGYIMTCIRKAIGSNSQVIEVKKKAEENYTQMIHKEMERTVWKNGGCTSWYQNKSGKVIAMYPGFSFTYASMTKNFKAKDHSFK